ncbi:MAG: glycosyltransferase [Anaerolineae bacterium]|nr:glycosyltransferase [Gloeobacterales cyanobacterium ES-bin-313]
MLPTISVIIPAYNVDDYIETTLNSLKCQTFQNFEALVVDDGSTDLTCTKVLPFINADNRFRLLSKKNGGLSSARNYGIQHARGKYIALLDGDDAYAPEKLATHIEILESQSNVGVVYSGSRIMRNDDKLTGFTLSGRPIHKDLLVALLYKNFLGHGSNGIFRRSLIDQVGSFDEALRSAEDVDFWLRIAATTGQFWRVRKPLAYYRVRPSGLSFNVSQMERSGEQVLESAYQRSPQRLEKAMPTARAYLYRYLARLALTANDSESARIYLDRALASDPKIFWQDPRSLLTLAAVRLSPFAQLGIRQILGTSQRS